MKKSGDDNIFVDDGEDWNEEDASPEETPENEDDVFLGEDEEEEE